MEKLRLKNIAPYLTELDETPLFRSPSFSLEEFSKKIKEKFQLENFSISVTDSSWQTQDEIKSSLGKNISQLCLIFTPLLGNIYFFIANEDIKTLTNAFLLKDGQEDVLNSEALENGFYRYIVLNVLNLFEKTPSFTNLNAKIVEDAEMKALDAFVLSLNIKINDKSVNTKIAITQDFRKSWNNFFLSEPSVFAEQMKNSITLPLQIIAGHVMLSKEEIKKLKEGDFVILDRCSLDLKENIYETILALNGNPLFSAKVKKNKLQIMDTSDYEG